MYAARVGTQKHSNPCLSDLHEFLCQPAPVRDRSRIVALDFFEFQKFPTPCEVPLKGLQAALHEIDSTIRDPSPQLGLKRQGRVLLVEDISKQIVEELGNHFEIDPLFFASYVHQAWRKTGTQSPESCSLPSRERKQDFFSLQYHRTISYGKAEARLSSLVRNCNHQRKVVVLPTMAGERIGLAQHCCAVWLGRRGDMWTGIILLDPAISDDYVASKRHGTAPPDVQSKPFLGGCEDFNFEPASPEANIGSSGAKGNSRERSRGMLEDLIRHWTTSLPPMFDNVDASLASLSYYPMKMVAAEWVNYIAVMGFCMREYELSINISLDLLGELEKLNSNLRILQGWRRRVLSTQNKLKRVIRFIQYHEDVRKGQDDWKALLEDYEYLKTEVKEYGGRLEAMVPIVTSAVALIESRRSLTETTNVTRLTILAVVFLPLSYVASLFSMSEDYQPGGPRFWMYFAISVPLTVIIGLIAKPPVEAVHIFINKFRTGLISDKKQMLK